MSVKIIQNRLNEYQPQNQLEEENALKEISQEIILAALSRAEFFKVGIFQGGTCLRILHGLNRFSEDLDFALLSPDLNFKWVRFLKPLQLELESYGYRFEIQDRSEGEEAVKVGFLKDDSIGKILVLRHRGVSTQKSIKIKFEIDSRPPRGGHIEQLYIDFPFTLPVLCHDLPSLFAGKSHAILCRPWAKGRDWYDFLWYVGKKITPNFQLLENSLNQFGPWQNQNLKVDKDWYLKAMSEKVLSIDWDQQKRDVARFLKQADLDLLKLWSPELFMDRIRKLEELIKKGIF